MVSNDRAFGLSTSRVETGISGRSEPARRSSSRLCPRDRPVLSQPGDIGKANAQSGDSCVPSPLFDFRTGLVEGRRFNGLPDPPGSIHRPPSAATPTLDLRIDEGMKLHPRFSIPHHYNYQE